VSRVHNAEIKVSTSLLIYLITGFCNQSTHANQFDAVSNETPAIRLRWLNPLAKDRVVAAISN
jgi:hypothetical protein